MGTMVDIGFDSRGALEKRADAAIVAAVGYFLLAALAIYATAQGNEHATIWPADAVILVLLLREPRPSWRWILIAGWCANLAANAVVRGWSPILIAYGAINMGQSALAAWFILRHQTSSDVFADTRSIWRFVYGTGVFAPVMGGVAGSLVTWLAFKEPFLDSFMSWYFSNALGLLILTPFIGALLDGSYIRWLRYLGHRDAVRVILSYLGLLAATLLVFVQHAAPLLFLPISIVTYLSFRLGRLGTKLGIMMVALIGVSATLMGYGPVAALSFSPAFKMFFLQLYLGTLLLTCMPIAAIVSSRKKAVIWLAEREEALRQILECTPNGCLGFDPEGHCKWSVGPIKAFLGLSSEEMIGRTSEAVSLEVHGIVEELLHESRALGALDVQGTRVVEFSPVRRPHLTLEGTIGVLRQEGEYFGVVITLRDVSERRASELAMLSRSEADDLTGLCNRDSFRSHLRSALNNMSRPISLALIDLDSFHAINETHSHSVGDAVLFEVARRIKRTARDTDVVARLSGDDFALILRCDLLTARGVCERITEVVRQGPVHRVGGVSVLASVSCGVVQLRPEMTIDEAFIAANSALQDMKQSGRNGVRVAA